jgi:hypothetical protein
MKQVEIDEWPIPTSAWTIELQNYNPPAGNCHTGHFANGLRNIRHIANSEANGYHIENRIGIRQLLRIRYHSPYWPANRLRYFYKTISDHRFAEVGADYPALRPYCSGKIDGKITRAGTDIQAAVARLYFRKAHCKPAPPLMLLKTQYGIQSIVLRCNRAKHLLYVSLFVVAWKTACGSASRNGGCVSIGV